MNDRNENSRKRRFLVAGGLVVFGLAAAGAIALLFPSGPDDAQELLRRAKQAEGQAPKAVGKSVTAKGKSSTGATVEARVQTYQEPSGRKAHTIRTLAPLKEGETVTVTMPGGGTVEMTRSREGEALKPPQAAGGGARP